MATKGAMVDKKRKMSSSAPKGKPDGKFKKAKVEQPKPKPVPESEDASDDFEDFSDSDDGGVKLGQQRDNNRPKGANGQQDGKTFERSEPRNSYLCPFDQRTDNNL
jgi:pumilio homology domain family member 6